MKPLERIILAAGLATMAFLLWKFDPGAVWAQIARVGWGFAFILPFQLFDQLLNAAGWRMSFGAEDAARVPFLRLLKARIAGDGVNYLTPSATIAGELVRPRLLGDAATEEARNASVVTAKFAQSLAQPFFIFLGLVFVLNGRPDLLEARQRAWGIGGALLAMVFLASSVAATASEPAGGARFWQAEGRFGPMRIRLRGYLRAHPGRFLLAILFFTGGFAWGALEVLLICRLMGIEMPLYTALAVETLSSVVDGLMFMVPGKVGTQEAGKTLIFRALGYAPGQGLAFGLIRHTREVVWACGGFLIYALDKRAKGS